MRQHLGSIGKWKEVDKMKYSEARLLMTGVLEPIADIVVLLNRTLCNSVHTNRKVSLSFLPRIAF